MVNEPMYSFVITFPNGYKVEYYMNKMAVIKTDWKDIIEWWDKLPNKKTHKELDDKDYQEILRQRNKK